MVKESTFAPLFKNLTNLKVDTLSYKTQSLRKEDVERQWYVVDARGENVGRLCSRIAHVLRGKHKTNYTPHVDNGDNVIVINAQEANFTGDKWSQKEYLRYSGYPGGLKRRTAEEQLSKNPQFIIENAVKGMLPKNRLGTAMFKKLHVYAGEEHPHEAQNPQPFNK